uniref:Integrase catalytic domain-containing protein n=1 Tax=Tanacetum cinerariifolium TaxID=118510 RepID=A0A6L2KAE1_TANCI|nr:hypothetical protein [Tanacetum cinerariifolium]
METYKNVLQDIRNQLDAKVEAVQIILTGIDNDIYSIVDACPNACETWKAIERLKQEWQRFMTLVKQSQELKTVSYHKLCDILKQHQNEVNEIRAERLARTSNPLALVAQQQPLYHPTHYTQNSLTRPQQVATKNKEQADWRDDTDDDLKIGNWKHIICNVTDTREHPEKPEYVNVTYLKEHDDINITTDSLNMSNNRGMADQDKDEDLAKERSRGTDLYSITLQDTFTPNPIYLMAKASLSQAWLWHRCLSHLNFDTVNLLSKYDIVTGLPKLKFIKDHLCSSCELRKEKPNWTHFLRSKDERPKVLINFLKLVQRGLHAQVKIVQTNKGTKFLNKTLHGYFAQEGIEHRTSSAQTPEQNGIIKRQNRTLVEDARTMLSAVKAPLFFLAEAIATSCFIQNRSLVIPRHKKNLTTS